MKAEDARQIYINSYLTSALQDFYEAIGQKAPFGLSGNFYDIAVNYDYTILRLVSEQLKKDGYKVAYADGEIRSTQIFSISWD